MPTPRETAGIIADLGRLTTRVEHLEGLPGRVEALEAAQEALAALPGQFAELTRLVEGDTPGDGEEPPGKGKKGAVGAVWWPSLSDEDYAEGRRELRGWLRDVAAVRYPDDVVGLTPCWERHPLAVDLVTAAWLLWVAGFVAGGAPTHDGADWHLRWRPELFAAAGKDCERCSRHGHQPPTAVEDDLLASFDPDRVPA